MFNYEAYQPHYHWWDSVYDTAKEAGRIIGIDVDDIRFSGFWSQGDGASFTGSYAYAKGAASKIRAEFPTATELHGIADALQSTQARHFYCLTASISQSGRYSHEMTMRTDVEDSRDSYRDIGDADEALLDAFRDFARWIYDVLEKEYEYQQAWNLARGWEDAAETAADEKATARQLIRDMRKARGGDVPASICNALRSTVRRHLAAMADALQERADIANAFAYWQDGNRVDVAEFAAANL